jgi:serpin B
MTRTTVGLSLGLTLLVGGAGAVGQPTKARPNAVVEGNSRFAFDLYARLREKEGNLFLSPYSISAALAMTYAGARGETAEQMAKVLHLPGGDRAHKEFAALVREINGGGRERGYQLSTANALWGQQGYPFRPDFLRLIKDDYGGGLQEVDFAQPEQARKTINAWVERETRDKIKDLIGQGVLNARTRLVLTNAIYFKSPWMHPFQKGATRDEPFYLTADKTEPAPLMHQTDTFGYAEGDGFQALELPYVRNELAMLVLLPKKKDGLAELEKTLTAERVSGVGGRLSRERVQVSLPRFKTTATFELSDVLSGMGMPRAFRGADFSGMTDRPDPLEISKVVHKAFVDVNEEGTEAAAATGVIVGLAAAPVPRPMPVFRADHPFVFLIRDTRSGSILFLGRLADPRG